LTFYTGAEKEFGLIDTDPGIEAIINAGLAKKEEILKIKFKETGKEHLVKRVKTYFYQVYWLLVTLTENLKKLKVNFVEKNVTSVGEEIKENFIFNCCGIGSRDILKVSDKKVFALCGHMIHLNEEENDKIKKLNYIILTNYKASKDAKTEYFIYMPKKGKDFKGVLGGTLIPHYEGGLEYLDYTEYHGIVRRARDIFGYKEKTPYPKF